MGSWAAHGSLGSFSWAAHGGSMGCARLPFVGLWGVTPMGWAEGVRLEDGPREDLVFRKIVIYLFF